MNLRTHGSDSGTFVSPLPAAKRLTLTALSDGTAGWILRQCHEAKRGGREGEGLCLASIVARMLHAGTASPPAGSAGVQKRCLWAWHAISQRLSPAHQTQFKLAQAHQAGLTLQHQGDQLLVCLRCQAGWLNSRAELAASSSCSRTVPAGVICWNGDVRRCSAPATGFGPTVMGRRCGVAAGTCTLQRLVTSPIQKVRRCGHWDDLDNRYLPHWVSRSATWPNMMPCSSLSRGGGAPSLFRGTM